MKNLFKKIKNLVFRKVENNEISTIENNEINIENTYENLEENDNKKLFDMVKNDNIAHRHTGVKLAAHFKKSLNLETSNHVTRKNMTVSEKKFNGVSKKEYDIKDEMDLYTFYKDNLGENNIILNKVETAKIFNVSVSTIRRLNDKLKAKNLLNVEGKNIYLIIDKSTNEGV